MPYRLKWVKPKLFLSYKGVKVYHTYKDDDIAQGPLSYHFVRNPYADLEGAFDVRELPNWCTPPHPPFLCDVGDTPENRAAWERYYADKTEEKHIRNVIRQFIDQNELPY